MAKRPDAAVSTADNQPRRCKGTIPLANKTVHTVTLARFKVISHYNVQMVGVSVLLGH